MAQHYVYKPLAESQIRLLNLSLDESEPHGIALSLCHVSLDDSKGKYVALSYTWGRPEPLDLDPTFQPDKIWRLKCDGGVVEVRQNLFDFLQQVRRAESNASAFWIDAVCINQQDDKEKSDQVLRMGQIYAASSQVWIWLGSRPINIEVQQMIEQVIPAMVKDFQDWNHDPEFYRSIDILDENWTMWNNLWRHYPELFARNWFERGWTVQEAALQAPEHCFVLVGPCVLRWQTVLWYARFLIFSSSSLQRMLPPKFASISGRALLDHHFDQIFPALQTGSEAITPERSWHTVSLELIIFTRNMSVEDPRDKIYAYLGIMLQNKPPQVKNSIIPDYTMDFVVVYRNFATVMLRNTPDLRLLALISNSQGRRYSMLPSWVPDFSHLPLNPPQRVYDASKRFHNRMNEPEISGNYLIIYGTRLATICSYGHAEEQFTDSLSQLIMYSFLTRKDEGTTQCVPEAVWKSVLTHVWSYYDREDQPLRTRVRYWLLQQTWDLLRHGALPQSLFASLARVGENDDVEWLPTLEEVMRPDTPTRDKDFETLLKNSLIENRLYYMTSGHFGIGPDCLRNGDEVWIFEGGHLPFVLRQNEDGKTHTLLGYTYVHGVMYGEAMTDELRSGFKPVTLV